MTQNDMKEDRSRREDTKSKGKGWIALGISVSVYTAVFWWVEADYGSQTAMFSIFPILLGSWYLGILGGLLFTFITLTFNILLFSLKGYSQPWMVFLDESFIGTVSIFALSAIVAYLGRVERQYKEAVNTRVRIAENSERQVASLTLLVNVTNEVLGAADMPSVLHILAEQTREMFGANDCLISIWSEEEEKYFPRAASGNEKERLEKLPPRIENEILAKLQTGDILVFAKPEMLGETGDDFEIIYPRGKVLALPLIAGEEKIGVLYLLYADEHEFSPNELTYAKLTSRQISLAISKGYLLEKTQEQLQEIKALHAVTQATAEATDESSLLQRVAESLGKLLYHVNVSIFLVNRQQTSLNMKASYQLDTRDRYTHIPIGAGITGKVFKTGQLERISDVRQHSDYLAAAASVLSEICVPIKSGNKILGVINIESETPNAFNKADERILTTVANQLSIALKRLRAEKLQVKRVKQIARSNQLIQALTEVSSQMEMSSSPHDVMQFMGAELEEIGLKTLVALFTPGSQELVIRYTSLEAEVVKKFERLAHQSATKEFRILAEDLPTHLNLSENLHPMMLPDHLEAIAGILKGFEIETIKRILHPVGLSEKTILGHFPLVFQEKILGFFWLWGTELLESDLPTLSIFSSQVASAIENARLFADVQRLAITDGLTGLYTRRHFFELAYEEFYRARRYEHPLSIIMLDLDHFKKVNDTYGHAAGDLALEKAAAACQNILRTQDIIGRYGGEEFVILLTETNLFSAEKVAQRLCQAVRNLDIPTKKGNIHLTISGGVAGDNVEEQNLIEMVEAADQAMYAAKQAGRNRIEITKPKPLESDG